MSSIPRKVEMVVKRNPESCNSRAKSLKLMGYAIKNGTLSLFLQKQSWKKIFLLFILLLLPKLCHKNIFLAKIAFSKLISSNFSPIYNPKIR